MEKQKFFIAVNRGRAYLLFMLLMISAASLFGAAGGEIADIEVSRRAKMAATAIRAANDAGIVWKYENDQSTQILANQLRKIADSVASPDPLVHKAGEELYWKLWLKARTERWNLLEKDARGNFSQRFVDFYQSTFHGFPAEFLTSIERGTYPESWLKEFITGNQ